MRPELTSGGSMPKSSIQNPSQEVAIDLRASPIAGHPDCYGEALLSR
jgi:hypothetical protein